MNNLDKIILIHKGPNLLEYISFDILVRKGLLSEEEKKKIKDALYEVDCAIVKKFLKKYPNYEYIASEDFGHIYFFNVGCLNYICKLYKEGFSLVDYDEDSDTFVCLD